MTWNVFTSISVQSCGPITPSPLIRDGTRASLFVCSSKISLWLLSSIFSIAGCCCSCWSAAITRTIFTVLIVSRERDLDASVAAAAVAERPAPLVPFSLLRREELRCQRCFSLEEVLRRLGRFTDSALALKPVAVFEGILVTLDKTHKYEQTQFLTIKFSIIWKFEKTVR